MSESDKRDARWSCYCGRMFTTKSGRTRHMLVCSAVPDRLKMALGRP